MKTFICMALCAVLGCAGVQKAASSFESCAAIDVHQIVDDAGTHLDTDLQEAMAADGSDLELTAAALGIEAGVDALDCAEAAVESAFAPGSAGSGSAVSPDAKARVKLVIASLRKKS